MSFYILYTSFFSALYTTTLHHSKRRQCNFLLLISPQVGWWRCPSITLLSWTLLWTRRRTRGTSAPSRTDLSLPRPVPHDHTLFFSLPLSSGGGGVHIYPRQSVYSVVPYTGAVISQILSNTVLMTDFFPAPCRPFHWEINCANGEDVVYFGPVISNTPSLKSFLLCSSHKRFK